jgi:hypothetical protein
MKYRCPVDDVVFDSKKIDREPTLEGHPECPGPECRKSFDGFPGAAKVEPISSPAPQKPLPGSTGGAAGVLDPAPIGQGW